MSAEQLWFQEARQVPIEPAASFHVSFGEGSDAAFADLLKQGYLIVSNGADSSTFCYEPMGGVIMGAPDDDIPDMLVANKSGTGFYLNGTGAWAQDPNRPQAFPRANIGYGTLCMAYRDTQLDGKPWSCVSQSPVPAGTPIWLRFVTYASGNTDEELETGPLLTLYFGGHLRLQITSEGMMQLSCAATPGDEGDPGWQKVAAERWMTAGTYAPNEHWLWIYELGARLVVRNVQLGAEGKPLGLVWTDPAPVALRTGFALLAPPLGTPLLTPYDYHVLRQGPWMLTGSGNITFALSPQYFRAGTTTVIGRAVPDTVGISGVGKTTPATVRLAGARQAIAGSDTAAIAGPVVTLTGYPYGSDDGFSWPWTFPPYPAPAALDTPGATFQWSIAWQNSLYGTVMLSAIDITLPALYGSDGSTGTDLMSTPDASVKEVRFVRDPDLARETAEIHVQVRPSTDFTAYRNVNLPVRFVNAAGDTIFRGLTGTMDDDTVADFGAGSYRLADLTFHAEGLWARIKHAKWPGGGPADGRLASDVLTEILMAVGMGSSEYALSQLVASNFAFPAPPPGQEPKTVWKPGTPVDQILDDLRKKWFGTSWLLYFDPGTGKFTVASLTGEGALSNTVAASFYQTSADAVAASTPYQVIRSPKLHLDPTEQKNQITVFGQDPDGRVLMAEAVDWPSIHGNEDGSFPWNYVGEVWQGVICDPGLTTQGAVNQVCANLYARYRYPRQTRSWSSCRVDSLAPGMIVALVGAQYGVTTNCLLRGISVDRSATPNELANTPMGIANYLAEVIVDGVTQGPVG